MTNVNHPGAVDVNGTLYLKDSKGGLVPLAAIKPVDLLMDETVRAMLADARELSALIAAFKAKNFERVNAFQALLAQEYGTTVGGKKGNITLITFDGRERAQVQVADLIEFGPELQVAKVLIDECLMGWTGGSAVELQAVVNGVFQVDKEGQVNRAELLRLTRLEITDDRWLRAMEAIKNSQRINGSRKYVRFYERPTHDVKWQPVTIDLASA